MELADECERLSPSASGGCGGVLEVIETPACLGVLLVKTVTSRPLLPAEPRYTHLHKTHTSFLSACIPQWNLCLHSYSCRLVTGPVGD